MRGYNGDEAQIERQLTCLVALICAVHQQVARHRKFRDRAQQGSAFRSIAGLPGGERKPYGASSHSRQPYELWCSQPWRLKKELYRRRNEIERLFRRLKAFRRIFSRFDKLDLVFIAFIYFALVIEALR